MMRKCISCGRDITSTGDYGNLCWGCAHRVAANAKQQWQATGWICPRCGRSNSPLVNHCDCYHNGGVTVTY